MSRCLLFVERRECVGAESADRLNGVPRSLPEWASQFLDHQDGVLQVQSVLIGGFRAAPRCHSNVLVLVG